MAFRIQWFVVFFCLLFAGGTLLLNHGDFSAGILVGSLLTALGIAAIIQPKRDGD